MQKITNYYFDFIAFFSLSYFIVLFSIILYICVISVKDLKKIIFFLVFMILNFKTVPSDIH